ncbi:hypothetical protein [Dysgonomonas sp. 25]|uniref:hypothetical protein n=1 Tax=Dysgonomonas sp. 25 TaxID=2302933 RepID=UPI0013D15C35|nr:hypothetical protein [Dysgonomonas sp. 25]NDV68301.1 hypothetical protein [Dysgonomonas sp. 25]
MRLIFKKEKLENPIAILGGLPWIENIEDWPKIPSSEKYMTHFMTIFSNISGDSFNSDCCISVFISYDLDKDKYPKPSLSDKYTVHNQADLIRFKEYGYTKVIITKKRDAPILDNMSEYSLPVLYVEKRNFTNEENEAYDKEFENSGMGLDGSTLMTNPYFEQDAIQFPMSEDILLQVDEWDLNDIFPDYKDIFQSGLAYLYLNKNYKKKQMGETVGCFFTQHT